MKDNQKVKIKIESTIKNLDSAGLPVGEPEISGGEYDGSISRLEDSISLLYTEESGGAVCQSEIRIEDRSVSVIKRGAIESRLIFREGERCDSVYSMPPYKFDCSVSARRIRIRLDDNDGRIDLYYNMIIGGAEKKVRMRIWIFLSSNQI